MNTQILKKEKRPASSTGDQPKISKRSAKDQQKTSKSVGDNQLLAGHQALAEHQALAKH